MNNRLKTNYKISEKFEKKQNSLTNNQKLSSNTKSSANLTQNQSKIKSYIKENKLKILSENNQLIINASDNNQKPLYEIHSARNTDKSNRLSPDTVKKYEQIKTERENVNRGNK